MILSHCPNCGFLFRSSVFVGAQGAKVILAGNRETCPNCGAMANIMDGVFEFAETSIRIISAPDITKDMYAAFAAVVQKAKDREIDNDQLVKEAEEIDPRFGKVAKMACYGPKYLLLALLFLALQQCTANIDVKLDINQLVDKMIGQHVEGGEGEKESKRPDAASKRPSAKHDITEARIIPVHRRALLGSVSQTAFHAASAAFRASALASR